MFLKYKSLRSRTRRFSGKIIRNPTTLSSRSRRRCRKREISAKNASDIWRAIEFAYISRRSSAAFPKLPADWKNDVSPQTKSEGYIFRHAKRFGSHFLRSGEKKKKRRVFRRAEKKKSTQREYNNTSRRKVFFFLLKTIIVSPSPSRLSAGSETRECPINR